MNDPMKLRGYTRNQLIEELARRANHAPTQRPEHWCHDCSHYIEWSNKVPMPPRDCPDNYNPCTKGHDMRFMVPDEIDVEYGFYRPVCADRKPLKDESLGSPRT